MLLTRDGMAATATGLLALASWLTELFGLGPAWLAFAVGLLAAAVGGSVIVVGAVRGVLARELNVDELVSIALIASVLAGEVLSAALVAFMMLGGKVLEDLTARRAARALENLGQLVPAMARVRRGDDEAMVPVKTLRPGDVVVVRPGERLPVDGLVIAGVAAVDQAPITGESLAVGKGPGHEVYAGTLASEGALEIRTTGVGAATALGRIGALVAQAEEERAPVVRAADQYARSFTPLILGLAALTYALTGQVTPAIAVLVVACPCALVLATPTAVIAGVAAGARRGLVIRGGARLELAGRVDVVCLDKTGTLTLGAPRVTRVVPLDGRDEEAVLALAAGAEQYSEHPIAGAVLARAAESGIKPARTAGPTGFRSWPGRGVAAVVNGYGVAVGTPGLLGELGIAVDPAVDARRAEVEAAGETALYVTTDGRVAGILGVADVPRPAAREAVAALRVAGVRRLAMLTGDNPTVAKAIGRAVGIDEVYAGLLPDEKVAWVRRLQAEGHRVAMVGDGVNDAPALAAADLAIVMGRSGTDLALDVADVAIMTDELPRAAEAILLSRRTLRLIYENLGFALFWNAIAIIAAAAGFLSPIAGALVHNIGSVAVVVNAGRLVGWQPGPRK
ncbi:MAG: cation-translocating P-type ATPase [Chloroflexi bacterium]|nr:cation-translocating P-type ATPase [Chloroflexota bacterium]